MLKDSDITRALLNEIKQKFISDKKRQILRESSKITDLVLVRSWEEKNRIVHLLESANIQCFTDEDSFRAGHSAHDDKDLLAHRVVLTRDWRRCSLPHFRTFLIEYDFSLKSFLTLLRNDANKLFIFLNKQIFRAMKLGKLRELVSPFFFQNLVSLNSLMLEKTVSHLPPFESISCRLKTVDLTGIKLYIRRLILQFHSLETKPPAESTKTQLFLKKVQKALRKKLLNLLSPLALARVWARLADSAGLFQFPAEKQKQVDAIFKYLMSRGVVEMKDTLRVVDFSIEVKDKGQFKKYVSEHPSLRFILESNAAAVDSEVGQFDAFIQKLSGNSLQRPSGQSLRGSRVVAKCNLEDAPKSKTTRTYLDLLSDMNRPVDAHRLKCAILRLIQPLLGSSHYYQLFSRKKLRFEFVKMGAKQAKCNPNHHGKVFQDDVVVNQEFLSGKIGRDTGLTGDRLFGRLGQMCDQNDELMQGLFSVFNLCEGPGAVENRLEYLQSHLANLKKRKIITMRKSEQLVYLFSRQKEFLECVGQILRTSQEALSLLPERERVQRALESVINKSVVSSRFESRGTRRDSPLIFSFFAEQARLKHQNRICEF